MSTSEPFMPAHEPPPEPDPRDREIDSDIDSDVIEEAGVDDPDAAAAVARHAADPRPVFRTPQPGRHLTPEALEAELEEPTD